VKGRIVSVQKLETQERIRSSRNVVSRVVADEALVVPIRGGAGDLDSIYTFNDSGTKLWAMLEEGRSATELAEYLEASYGITASQAQMDADSFVAELRAEGLIERA
jgi:Coenzyme PQQ synthesis protein D (PqqD)